MDTRLCEWCQEPIHNPTSAQKYHQGECRKLATRFGKRMYMRERLRSMSHARQKNYREIRARSRGLAVQWRKDNPELAAELDAAREARGMRSPFSATEPEGG